MLFGVENLREREQMLMKYSELSRRYAGLLGGVAITALAVLVIGCGGGGGSSVSAGADSGANAGADSGANAGADSGADSGANAGADSGSAGVLPSNVVFYTETPTASVSEIRYITPAGGGDTSYASLGANYACVALNPVNANQRFFAYQADATSPYGIYKNGTVNFAGAVQVVAPTYASVISLQMANDGNTLYYVAAAPGADTPQIFKVATAGGTPVALDNAEDAHLNAAGTTLVYSKLTPAFTTDIWKRGVNTADVPVRLTNSDGEDEFVQWSKDGTKIAFSSDRSGTMRVYTMAADGTNVHQVTSTGETLDLSPSFNSDGSKIAYLAISNDAVGSPSNLTTVSSAGTDQGKVSLKAAQDFLLGTYWTGTNGRAIGVTPVLGQRFRRQHKH